MLQRSAAHLKAIAFSALMNHGAPTFIDAVDPVGTINRAHYERAGEVFAEVEKYELFTGGDFVQDVAIYYSLDALFDLDECGRSAMSARYNFEPGRRISGPAAHRNAAIAASRMLVQHHIPYGVITRKDLGDLSRFRLVILPNVALLTADETDAFRAYVAAGGCLYASCHTGMLDIDGHWQGTFALADVFGVDYDGETEEVLTYIALINKLLSNSNRRPIELSPRQVDIARGLSNGLSNKEIAEQLTLSIRLYT